MKSRLFISEPRGWKYKAPAFTEAFVFRSRMQRSVQHEKTFFLLSTAPSTRNPPFSVFCVHHGFRRMFYDVRTDALYRASVVSQEDGRNPRHTRDCSLDQISAQALSCRNCRSKQRFVNDRNTKTSRKGGLCVWLVR